MGGCLNCNTRELDASIGERVRLSVSCVLYIFVCSTRFMRQMTVCVLVSDCVDEYACVYAEVRR